MSELFDWSRKLGEAADWIKTRYEHIGRKTGAPFLAVVYPPEAERAVYKECRTLFSSLGDEFAIKHIDVLAVTMLAVEELGCDNIVQTIIDPMPGANPESDLGYLWVTAISQKVSEQLSQSDLQKAVVILEHLAALYPATGPENLMQHLWETSQEALKIPVLFLIPGTIVGSRVYSFLNLREEFMYRGDIL
ncbi:MAG: hypothetical protein DCF22_12145 [Leptolyngbya sp.]|nr:MAG: hypothetical protein DCF22_12145 [Leptolyngbya sp.]